MEKRKNDYVTVLIDLMGSRTIFDSQKDTDRLINHMLGQLNDEVYTTDKRHFSQKDGDSIMLILPIQNIPRVFSIFKKCLAMYYSKKFQYFLKRELKINKAPQFYFSIGVGDITTDEIIDADIANGTSISRAKEGIDTIKQIVRNKDFKQYQFKSTPFKLFVNAADKGEESSELANECNALFYLLYEKILTTSIQKIIYGILFDNPEIKLVDIGKMLFNVYGIESYRTNYKDIKARAKISSRISIIKKRMDKEPIKLTEKAILSTLKNFIEREEIK